MISVKIVCVGKLKEKWLSEACVEYEKRLSRYCRLTVAELPEHSLPENPSVTQIADGLEKESVGIIKACEGFYAAAGNGKSPLLSAAPTGFRRAWSGAPTCAFLFHA